jgi:large repetitive protein
LPSNLAVTSTTGTIESGAELTITWQIANIGNQPALGPWQERVILRNLDRGNEVLANVLVVRPGRARAGESADRSVTLRLPDGAPAPAAAPGGLHRRHQRRAETGIGGQGENNNSAALEFSSDLARYPDLTVSNLVVEPAAGWAPGSTVTCAGASTTSAMPT